MSRKQNGAAGPPVVGVLMGSSSDWETMRHACEVLDQLAIPYETRVVSAHRTPDLLFDYASKANGRGLKLLIAGAGGSAHLPGMLAAKTLLPILGVPIESAILRGVDSLLSIVQMPAGIPVATFAIGKPGAINAALFAAAILSTTDSAVHRALKNYRVQQTKEVLRHSNPRDDSERNAKTMPRLRKTPSRPERTPSTQQRSSSRIVSTSNSKVRKR